MVVIISMLMSAGRATIQAVADPGGKPGISSPRNVTRTGIWHLVVLFTIADQSIMACGVFSVTISLVR